jgi:hypothetical protein
LYKEFNGGYDGCDGCDDCDECDDDLQIAYLRGHLHDGYVRDDSCGDDDVLLTYQLQTERLCWVPNRFPDHHNLLATMNN